MRYEGPPFSSFHRPRTPVCQSRGSGTDVRTLFLHPHQCQVDGEARYARVHIRLGEDGGIGMTTHPVKQSESP